ncbi:hypothetical protein Hanom_Chr03g00244431 [Helianthus anomalus]
MCKCMCVRGRERENLIWRLLCTKTAAIKQESNGVDLNRLPVTVCIHQLLKLCASFDPKKNFVSIL